MLATGTKRMFRVSNPTRYLRTAALVCFGTLILLFLVTGSEEYGMLTIFFLGVVMAIGLGIGWWVMTRTRLELTPDEIVYHSIGYKVRSSWENVEGWGKRVQGVHDIDSLILREPGMELSGWMRAGDALMPVMNIAALLSGRPIRVSQLDSYSDVIPVGMFDQAWRDGEIGALVRQYAPGAYEKRM